MEKLDDLELLELTDKSGMLKLAASFPKLLLEGTESRWVIKPEKSRKITNVVVIGYGGSAISGDILRNWLIQRATVPLEVCRDLELPAYAGEDTLAVCVSYSGETVESLKLLDSAIKACSQVVAITSGGTMGEVCSVSPWG